MCRVCKGNFPTEEEYYDLRNQAQALLSKWATRGGAATNPAFVPEVVELDKIRTNTGAGWGNPDYLGEPIRLIFNNSDAEKGLLLFVICIWMSYREKAKTVWTKHLVNADNWISGRRSTPPQHRMPSSVTPLLNKTRNVAINSGSIANWFADAIETIASPPDGMRLGNIYRMAGYVLLHLLDAASKNWNDYVKLEKRQCALLGDWKRLWLLLMYLRRDNSLVRCLFERALGGLNNGKRALQYWYDDNYFDPKECQLPVDKWVKDNWSLIMKPSKKLSGKDVAGDAIALASRHGVSPSVFDVLFLARE